MPAALKLVRIGGGFLLLIAGVLLALPGVPGPGIPIVLLALAILSRHFTWAERAVSWIKRKIRR
jgi:hypothetical protein